MLSNFLQRLMRECWRDMRTGRWISPSRVMLDAVCGNEYPVNVEYYAKTYSNPVWIYAYIAILLQMIVRHREV